MEEDKEFDPFPHTDAAPDQSSFYQPLPSSRSFRLMHIYKLPESDEEGALEFFCNLETFELGSHPPYSALSYTWGQPYYSESGNDEANMKEFSRFDYAIFVDAEPFAVTLNFARAMSLIVRRVEPTYLWADQMCINQADVENERPQQVSMMGEIFGAASEVLVWIGHYNDQAKHLHWASMVFVTVIDELVKKHGEDFVVQQSIMDADFLELLGLDQPAGHLREAADFYGRCRTFDRAWIVQEVARARKPRVFCGIVELQWDNLVRLGELFEKATWTQIQSLGTGESPTTVFMRKPFCESPLAYSKLRDARSQRIVDLDVDPTGGMQALLHGATQSSEMDAAGLLNAVSGIRRYSATDPRDKIYAALGLPADIQLQTLDAIIQPNYTVSDLDVYVDFALKLLSRLPFLSLFWFLDCKEDHLREGWASWVPDWSNRITIEPVSMVAAKCSVTFNVWGHEMLDTKPETGWAGMDDTNRKLFVTGIPISAVTSIAFTDGESLWDGMYDANLNILEMCLQLSKDQDGELGESRVERMWRTMVLNCTTDGTYPAPASYKSSYKAFITMWLGDMLRSSATKEVQESPFHAAEDVQESVLRRIMAICNGFQPEIDAGEFPAFETIQDFSDSSGGDWLTEGMRAQPERRALREQSNPFTYSVVRNGRNRRYFQAEQKFIGAAPEITKVGDEIWFIRGATTPMLLRPAGTNGELRVVGESYLHGAMLGEMTSRLSESDSRSIILV